MKIIHIVNEGSSSAVSFLLKILALLQLLSISWSEVKWCMVLFLWLVAFHSLVSFLQWFGGQGLGLGLVLGLLDVPDSLDRLEVAVEGSGLSHGTATEGGGQPPVRSRQCVVGIGGWGRWLRRLAGCVGRACGAPGWCGHRLV